MDSFGSLPTADTSEPQFTIHGQINHGSVASTSGSRNPPPFPTHDCTLLIRIAFLLRTCPLSKFSFSSSRLLAPPVRRITLGIALGTCCMEFFIRSIALCLCRRARRRARCKNPISLAWRKTASLRGRAESNYDREQSILCWPWRPVRLAFLAPSQQQERREQRAPSHPLLPTLPISGVQNKSRI